MALKTKKFDVRSKTAKVILCVMVIATISFVTMPIAGASVEENVTTNPCLPGCWLIDFEDGTDGAVILSTIPGLQFTTTMGHHWIYGDKRVGYYNVYPYGERAYVCNGDFFAWLGVYGDQGRIDFTQGTASYFSVLTSTYSGIAIDAYDSEDNLIATSGWATDNLWTGTFTRLTVKAPNMAYVIIHDTGNWWLIDDIVTDAPSIVDIIEATVDIDPDTLNLKGKGQWITCYIELPEGYDVADIDATTVLLDWDIPAVVDTQHGFTSNLDSYLMDHDGDGILEYMVKFDRAGLETLGSGKIELTVTGLLTDGTLFRGTDTIRVISK